MVTAYHRGLHRPRSGYVTAVLVMKRGVSLLDWVGLAPLGAQLTLYPPHLHCAASHQAAPPACGGGDLSVVGPRWLVHEATFTQCSMTQVGYHLPGGLTELSEYFHWPTNV